jgi:hypothetical protein
MEDLRPHDDPPPFLRSRFGLGCVVLAAVAGWFLWTEHRAHVFGALPWLVLLACPLMHVFMHHGHHGHAPSDGKGAADGRPNQSNPGATR